MTEEPEPAALGLRERKKAKTKAAIQAEAMRLFRENGYAATTVEQIAEAAEVSPSTFFRYFPTKEDVVFVGEFDTRMIEALAVQPDGLTPLQAAWNAIRAALSVRSADAAARSREHYQMILSTPELRMKTLDSLNDSIQVLAEAIGAREGRSPDDVAVRTLAGALTGVALSALMTSTMDPSQDFLHLMEASIPYLEAGLLF